MMRYANSRTQDNMDEWLLMTELRSIIRILLLQMLAIFVSQSGFATIIPNPCIKDLRNSSDLDLRLQQAKKQIAHAFSNQRYSGPFISRSEIRDVQPVWFGGNSSIAHFLGTFEGKRVFIKVPTEDLTLVGAHPGVREAEILRALNQVDVGIRFYGATQLNGKFALVVEYIPGAVMWKPGEAIPSSITVTQETLGDVSKAGERLSEIGIFEPWDLQFLISADGRARLADVAFFEQGTSAANTTKRFTDIAVEQLSRAIRTTKSNLPPR